MSIVSDTTLGSTTRRLFLLWNVVSVYSCENKRMGSQSFQWKTVVTPTHIRRKLNSLKSSNPQSLDYRLVVCKLFFVLQVLNVISSRQQHLEERNIKIVRYKTNAACILTVFRSRDPTGWICALYYYWWESRQLSRTRPSSLISKAQGLCSSCHTRNYIADITQYPNLTNSL